MSARSLRSTYANPRMAALVGLGFASGLPLMLTSRTLRVWLRGEGVELAAVGLIGLVTLPYAYKFLWAPVMDRFAPPLLDRRRGWILIIQILLMLSIGAMAWAGPQSGQDSLKLFALLAVIVAFLSASQDIVADAYRTDVLKSSEFGAGASVYTTGYRVAMLATGAGAVWLGSQLPWRDVYLLAAAVMLLGIVATLCAPSLNTRATPSPQPSPPRGRGGEVALCDRSAPMTLYEAVVEPARDFLQRNGRRAFIILAFVFVFKIPDYMAIAMMDAMLLDIGYTLEQISLWSLGAGTAATIPGALVGGIIVTRLGLWRSLVIFGIAQAVSNAGYLGLAHLGEPHQAAMIAVVGVEYFCVGLVAAGFIAFLMSQCNRRFSATQYALLSSLMGLSNSLAGAPSGYLAEYVGYQWFFFITILIAIPGLAMLPWLRGRITLEGAANEPLAMPA